jgi:hypothetical protein
LDASDFPNPEVWSEAWEPEKKRVAFDSNSFAACVDQLVAGGSNMLKALVSFDDVAFGLRLVSVHLAGKADGMKRKDVVQSEAYSLVEELAVMQVA